MPKPYMAGSARMRRPGQARRGPSWQGELSPEMKRKLALNRFTYSGGFDGYEGRMMLSPEPGAPKGAAPARRTRQD
ncbi:hypothetical protein [Methylobacterium organophilum]|uniref:Uncharacterized protein n=1 Tax=Methylobacterium organophilum TaxID=410 RepID=A0ABQ4TF12_METOR|nr:hypothetical protein [Methylobacterium organophilum]UMY18437.1 hypothetical protein MMB17_03600 [Methylobacterium organophilum]GJE29031.1 hypothetical protein LKMONMHP_3906 [Methylobacterium organophilum]